jgi:hypothetical protein
MPSDPATATDGRRGLSRLPRIRLACAAALLPLTAAAGPYAPEAGRPGSTAVAHDDPACVAWAARVVDYVPGVAEGSHPEYSQPDPRFQQPEAALGPVGADVYSVVSLGGGGSITLAFSRPLRDGPGWDFAVFENAINDYFLELAYVEVSSDGEHFVRFPVRSHTPAPVGAYGLLDASNIDGFAGKYRLGYGTPFDLADLRDLAEAELLDFERIRMVRIVDVIGDGRDADADGRPIYDPFPTFGSVGFDLAGVGARHLYTLPAPQLAAVSEPDGRLRLAWSADADAAWRLEVSADLRQWQVLETGLPLSGERVLDGARWYRIVLED